MNGRLEVSGAIENIVERSYFRRNKKITPATSGYKLRYLIGTSIYIPQTEGEVNGV